MAQSEKEIARSGQFFTILLGLIFLGVSLWLLLPDPPRREYRRWGLFFGALVAFIGAITVIEYVLRIDLRIDQLLFRDDIGVVAAHAPGRMPPITATTILALGLALLLLDAETRTERQPAQVLSLWGGFTGIMSLSGLINGATATYRVFSYKQVDVYTALILFMMSAAIFFARPRWESRAI